MHQGKAGPFGLFTWPRDTGHAPTTSAPHVEHRDLLHSCATVISMQQPYA
jgi:hypothetical protein